MMVEKMYLILDTKHTLNTFYFRTYTIKDKLRITSVVCDLLINEMEAEYELSQNYLSNMPDRYKDDEFINMELSIKIMNILGNELLIELRRINAYKNGILPFKFYGLINNDIILKYELMLLL